MKTADAPNDIRHRAERPQPRVAAHHRRRTEGLRSPDKDRRTYANSAYDALFGNPVNFSHKAEYDDRATWFNPRGVFSSSMFYDGLLPVPQTRHGDREHATLLFREGGVVHDGAGKGRDVRQTRCKTPKRRVAGGFRRAPWAAWNFFSFAASLFRPNPEVCC